MNQRRKIVVAAVLALTASGVLSGGLYYWWLTTPPPMPRTADEAAAMITSARFKRLSDDRKLAYVAHIRKLMDLLDAEERRRLREEYGDDPALRAAMRDLGEQFVVDMARRYAQAPPLQRQIMLDTIIGMMEKDQARRDKKADAPPTEEDMAKREERRNKAVSDLAGRAAKGNPQHGAYLGVMIKDMQKRRGQLGLPEWRPPER